MDVRLRDLMLGLRDLNLAGAPVLVHSSYKSLGPVEGGPETVVNALVTVFKTVIAPTFTYKTMITPLAGPDNNGITYGSQQDQNRMAEFYKPGMPADPRMGVISETVRRYPRAKRSCHPVLSLAGFNADKILVAQTLNDPLAPLDLLEIANGWVILLGVDHTVNTSIHYAVRITGRRQFIRWALTPRGVVECPGFPGCSAGFPALAPEMDKFARKVKIGEALVQAFPLKMLFKVVAGLIKKDPLALLCSREDCEECNAIRNQ